MQHALEAFPPVPVVQDQADEDESSLGGSVTMSRALAVSAHGLTLNEARVMMLACRLIDPRKAPHAYARDGYVKVRVTADEFAQLANMAGDGERTPTAAYEGLKAACDKLFERRASWREGKKTTKLAWVWRATYHDGEGWAEVCFSPDMTRHLFMLGERFVRYRIELARGLRSLYSSNLLRLLMTQKDTRFLAITLADFRHAMEVPETYRYADITRRVIAVAVKELCEKTELDVQCQEVKKGRSVHSLRFTFAPKTKPPQEPLFNEEA